MSDHPLVQVLHAAISRRNWHDVEVAANRIRDENGIQWPPYLTREDAAKTWADSK
jgi:hypothetical protein